MESLEKIITKTVESAIQPLSQKIKELELLIAAIESDNRIRTEGPTNSPILSRKQLAKTLDCSQRYLQDSPEFRAIAKTVGGRVFYDWEEVRIVVNNKNLNRTAKHV